MSPPKKPRTGRPPITKTEKTTVVQLRVGASQKAAWERAADEAGKPNLSSWIRSVLDAAATELVGEARQTRTLEQLLRDLKVERADQVVCRRSRAAAVGGNLEQIKHRDPGPHFYAGAGEVPHYPDRYAVEMGISEAELELLVDAGADDQTDTEPGW